MLRDKEFEQMEREENLKAVKLFTQFVQHGTSAGFALLALMLSGYAASVLCDGGFRMRKLVAVALPDAELIDEISTALELFPKRLLSSRASEKSLHRQIYCGHDDIFPFVYEEGENTVRTLDTLQTTMLTGNFADCTFCAVPVVFFQGVVPEGERDRFSIIIDLNGREITLLKGEAKMQVRLLASSYLSTRWRSCMQKINRQLSSLPELPADIKVMLASGLMLENALRWAEMEEGILQQFHVKMERAIKTVADMTESYGEGRVLRKWFVELLRKTVAEHQLPVCPLEKLQAVTGEAINQNAILADANHYYLSAATFRKVCRGMSFASPARIKQALAEGGILCTEGQGRLYMTKKLKVEGFAGGKRFIWLKKSAIDMFGKLALTELGGKNDGEI